MTMPSQQRRGKKRVKCMATEEFPSAQGKPAKSIKKRSDLKSLPFKNYMQFYDLGWILQSTEWQVMVRSRSRGRVQGICKPP